MPHWAALSVPLILVLHILLGKAILEFEEIHISIKVSAVSVSCWCAMRIYAFPCGICIDSMKSSLNMIYEDNTLLKTHKKQILI